MDSRSASSAEAGLEIVAVGQAQCARRRRASGSRVPAAARSASGEPLALRGIGGMDLGERLARGLSRPRSRPPRPSAGCSRSAASRPRALVERADLAIRADHPLLAEPDGRLGPRSPALGVAPAGIAGGRLLGQSVAARPELARPGPPTSRSRPTRPGRSARAGPAVDPLPTLGAPRAASRMASAAAARAVSPSSRSAWAAAHAASRTTASRSRAASRSRSSAPRRADRGASLVRPGRLERRRAPSPRCVGLGERRRPRG